MIRKKIEILWLKLAFYVLYHRNVQRSKYISRADNNHLSYEGEKLEQIIKRIKSGYENI